MLRLLPAVEYACPPGRVCRRASCADEPVEPYGLCERCGELHEEELERLRGERAMIIGEIDRRFPGLLDVLTMEHVAALPAHLAVHYRPGDDWRFVLAALHDCWTETIERLVGRVVELEEAGG